MKRAKSNEQIVEEFFNNRPFASPPNPGLKLLLQKQLSDLIDALTLGTAPPSRQAEAGRLLQALTGRHRGRPALLKTPHANFHFSMSVDWIAARYAAQGDKHPRASALRDIRDLELKESGKPLSEETLKDYYRKGVSDRGRVDLEFALQINRDARLLEDAGSENGVEEALAARAKGRAEEVYFNRLRYDRGQSRLIKSEKK